MKLTFRVFKWLGPILLFLALSFDGRTHWDETNYLYKAAYAPLDFNAEWLSPDNLFFYRTKVAHIIILRLLTLALGRGLAGLLLIEGTMAVMVIVAAYLFYLSLNLAIPSSRKHYAVFIAFLFSPVAIYLGFKSSLETTALFFTSLAIYLFVRSLRETEKFSAVFFAAGSSLSLFVAANCRDASLLAFASLVLPLIILTTSNRRYFKQALYSLVLLGGVWLILYILVSVTLDIRCTDILTRFDQRAFEKQLQDIADYPPNPIAVALYGGAFWVIAAAAVLRWRNRTAQIAILASFLSFVPISVYAAHIELRYLSSALFGFSMLCGVGLEVIYDYLDGKFSRSRGLLLTSAIILLAIASNQLLRPFQDTGTDGFPLIRLMERLRRRHPDPLVLTAHPHSTYAFLRICYPDMRIVLDRDFEGMAPIVAAGPAELEDMAEPWLYLSSIGSRDRPLLMKLIHRLRGVELEVTEGPPVIATAWVDDPDRYTLELVAREGRYLLFEIRELAVGNN